MRGLAGAVVLGALFAAAPADGAVTIGPDPLPKRTVVIGFGAATIFTTATFPNTILKSPIDGVVTRWRVRRGEGPGILHADKVSLRILASTDFVNRFTAAGTSEIHDLPAGAEDPKEMYEFPTQLPIAAGDTIGLGTKSGEFPAADAVGASYLVRVTPLADGNTATLTLGGDPNRYVLVNADVEADCDKDGFGDETQDSTIPPTLECGFIAQPQPPAAAPDTRIAKGPKKRLRTHSRGATVKFTFNADDPAASFECKLDKGKYRRCSSPQLYRVKAGDKFKKHTFKVRATSAAGTVDSTPATRTFKVKRLGA